MVVMMIRAYPGIPKVHARISKVYSRFSRYIQSAPWNSQGAACSSFCPPPSPPALNIIYKMYINVWTGRGKG